MKLLKLLFLAVFLTAALPFYALSVEENYINVLCYHRFKDVADPKDSYNITPKRFEEHMQFLKDSGYTVIPMSQYLKVIEGKEEMPEKAVVITIDDGYSSIKDKGYPVLKKFKYPSISYVYSVFFPGGKHSLTPADAKELMNEGLMEFGSHSHTHPVMTKRGKMTDQEYIDFLILEIITSKRYMEKKLGITMDTMAYPYGAYSKEIFKVVEKAGFKAAFSVDPSYNVKDTYKFALRRTIIYNSTTVAKLKAILEKKPLKISLVNPESGDIITDGKTDLKAVLAADAGLNTATIRFEMGRVVLDDSVYDPATKTLTYAYDKPLPKGFHTATVAALDMAGARHEYVWSFIVGKPIAEGVLEEALSKIPEPKKEN